MRASLKYRGVGRIGFRGGTEEGPIYAAGQDKLWWVTLPPSHSHAIPRYGNAFGFYSPTATLQTIVVEINVPAEGNSGRVAGFFARGSETGATFLMHSGDVGGGRPGIGGREFLAWSRSKLVDVASEVGSTRRGIAIARLNDSGLTGRIWHFVQRVNRFKEAARSGELKTPQFERQVEEFYRQEFSGKKKGTRGGTFEYLTYHGDIVQKLYEERSARRRPGEQIVNTNLIDLCVKKDGRVTELYEVKTELGRQTLYAAIGQLVTHSAADKTVKKFLVVPAGEPLPRDFNKAIEALGICVRTYKFSGDAAREIELDRPR